jgi:hypothetical protein
MTPAAIARSTITTPRSTPPIGASSPSRTAVVGQLDTAVAAIDAAAARVADKAGATTPSSGPAIDAAKVALVELAATVLGPPPPTSTDLAYAQFRAAAELAADDPTSAVLAAL